MNIEDFWWNKHELPPNMYVRPRWYWQRQSDRLKRILARISMSRTLYPEHIKDIAERWSPRHATHPGYQAIIKSVYDWNYKYFLYKGEKVNVDWFFSNGGYFKIVSKTTDNFCNYCGKPLFNKNHWRCNDRLCREMQAVRNGKHKEIRMRIPKTQEEFIAEFIIRKSKLISRRMKNATRHLKSETV